MSGAEALRQPESRGERAAVAGEPEVLGEDATRLIPCVECGQQLSRLALHCPGCGHPVGQLERLVRCPHCEVEVVPYRSSRDQITKQCPRCERAIVNVGLAKGVFAAWLALVIVPAALGGLVLVLLLLGALVMSL